MKRVILLFAVLTGIASQNISQTVTDIAGNVYHTVTIGKQLWMVENLKTTLYHDSTSVPGTYTYNGTTNNDTINTYGRLYNWHTVKPGKLCPTGWHIPTDAEWTTLITFLGGISIAGGKLKETGTTHWLNPNTGATNETGFTALPGGIRFGDNKFYSIGSLGHWWSSTEDQAHIGVAAWSWFILNSGSGISRISYGENNCLSVRCLNDNPTSVDVTKIDDIEIYPNPSDKMVIIKNILSQDCSVYVINLLGEQVLYQQHVSNSIDISNLKNGIYFIKVFDSGKIRVAKFVKE
jgi:uncharacterized protein (TIGR02145 family)